jgi:hypothetical protein
MANRPNPSQPENERDVMEDDDVRGRAEEEGEDADEEFEDDEFSDEDENEDEE